METSAGVSTETGVAPSVGLLLCTLLVIGHLRLMQQNLSFAVDQLVSFVKQVVSPEPLSHKELRHWTSVEKELDKVRINNRRVGTRIMINVLFMMGLEGMLRFCQSGDPSVALEVLVVLGVYIHDWRIVSGRTCLTASRVRRINLTLRLGACLHSFVSFSSDPELFVLYQGKLHLAAIMSIGLEDLDWRLTALHCLVDGLLHSTSSHTYLQEAVAYGLVTLACALCEHQTRSRRAIFTQQQAPQDLLRTQMAISMTSLWDRMPHSSYTAAAEEILRSEGIPGLYRGLMPTMLGILPHAGTSFLVFETLKPWTRRALGLWSERDLPIWARLCCGGVAGLVAQGASYPLHVVRRRMQVQRCIKGQNKYHSVLHALLTILRKEGFVKGLYKGSSLTLIKGPVSAACGFTANDFLKSILLGSAHSPERCPPRGWPDGCEVVRDPSKALKKLTPIDHLMTGGAAGAVAKTVIAPADRVKILYQTNNNRPFSWHGVRRTFFTIYTNTGVTGLWRGHCATLMQVIPKSATTYMTFDRYRHWISKSTTLDNVSIRFLAGALAGATATSLTYPLDMMRARMAAHWDMTPRYPNYFAAFERVLKDEGISSFYKGIRPTLMGIMPYAGLSFMAYETLKAHLVADEADVTVHQRLFCGACAGIFAQSTTYPLDIIRRRMQVHPGLYRNELHALRAIYRSEGLVGGLFKGVSMNWIKGPVAVGVSFTVNDILKKQLMQQHNF